MTGFDPEDWADRLEREWSRQWRIIGIGVAIICGAAVLLFAFF